MRRKRFFAFVVRRPWWVLAPLLALVGISLASLTLIEKDTRSDAFLAPDNPALTYRNLIRERFGLTDPMLVALVASGERGIYTAPNLRALESLTHSIAALPNVDADSVKSLATESLIRGTGTGIEVVPLMGSPPSDSGEAAQVRAMVEEFPMFLGTLAARDGSAALIAANLREEARAEETYGKLRQIVEEAELPGGLVAHVAGEGAIAGFLGAYIDADAKRLNPLATTMIVLIIVVAFRRLAPALLAVFMMLASVGGALGAMAALNIPFYVITNALPVILIGIAVADTIHIMSHFYDAQVEDPRIARDTQIVATLDTMFLPISITSLTTAAGFLGLYFAADMPPFKYFGLFAALGVALAWVYSILALPALMKLLRVQVAQRFIDKRRAGGTGVLQRYLADAGVAVLRHARAVCAVYLVLAVAGIVSASRLTVDADRIGLFNPKEPIVAADRAINEHLDGSSTLDIVIEAEEAEGLFDPHVLEQIDSLQSYALSLPHVRGANSIVDYLKQMNRVLTTGARDEYVLPDTREKVAQYFLLYSFASDPEDFAQEIDYDYRTANVRITMNSGAYQDIKPVYEALDGYIETEFDDSIRATLTGRVSLNYHWLRGIGDSHFAGLAFSLLLVFCVAALSFRSLVGGAYALLPVMAAVLIVYIFMELRGLTLGVGTSMFAAVAIGLGVDFAIHTVSRLQTQQGDREEVMFRKFFGGTGRALLLNVLAVASGFGVLVFSEVAQLRDFGSIVVLSMAMAFIASMTLLPASVVLLRPRFLSRPAVAILGAGLALVSIAGVPPSFAQTVESASQVVERVNAVPSGERVTRRILFRTTDKRGRVRERETMSFRRYFGDERRLALFFTAPANIRDTAVLTWDYPDTTEDDQWLYLPALRKVRRIPAADRGDYFLGTDFSFEDMKLDGKLSAVDYDWTLLESQDGGRIRLAAKPVNDAVAEELGYSRTETVVDRNTWIVQQADFWDVSGEYLKTLEVHDVREVDGILTRHRLVMTNHQTGHSTELIFSDVDYQTPIDEGRFTRQALQRGL